MNGSPPTGFRLVTAVAIAGLIAGLSLAMVYRTTQPRIAAHQREATQKAIFEVIPGTTSLVTYKIQELQLNPVASENTEGGDQQIVYMGLDDQKNCTGFAIPAKGPGFQDSIKVLYGYRPESQRIVGMVVLESRETPGLGDKIITDKDFTGSFRNLLVTPEIVAQTKGPPAKENEVDSISGATISSKAIVRLLNQSLQPIIPILNNHISKDREGTQDE